MVSGLVSSIQLKMQAAVDACFQGIVPNDFDRPVLWVAPPGVRAPQGFAASWAARPDNMSPGTAWLHPDELERMDALVTIWNACDENEVESISTFLDWMDDSGHAPPLFCMPVMPDGSHPNDVMDFEERLLELSSRLFEYGADEILRGQPKGFELVLAVRCGMVRTQGRADHVCRLLQESAVAANRLQLLEAAVHTTLWEYLPKRGQLTSIPPVDYRFVNEDEHHVAGLELGRRLGAGAFGSVFEIRGEDDRAEVLKVMSKSTFLSTVQVRRINNSLKVMSMLRQTQHRNITAVLGVLHTPSLLCMRMEHGGTENLFHLIVNRDRQNIVVPAVTMHSIATQVVGAIVHLHSIQICHRDIKPENLVVRRESVAGEAPNVISVDTTVKLTDFDTATQQPPGRTCSSTCGTFPFVAPEVCLEHHYDGIAADVWSAGTVLLELICRSRIVEHALNFQRPAPQPGSQPGPNLGIVRALKDAFEDRNRPRLIIEQHAAARSQPLRPVYLPVITNSLQVSPTQRWTSQYVQNQLTVEIQ